MTFINLLRNATKYIFLFLGVLIILQINGVNVTSLMAGVGIISIVVGLALQDALKDIIAPQMIKPGVLLILFSTLLIVAKTMALRVAPNPGYVTALLLIAPIFIFALNRFQKIPDEVSVTEGFAMIFFLLLLVVLVTGNYGILE
jgi:hypothetical protein